MSKIIQLSSSTKQKIFFSTFFGVGVGTGLVTISLHTFLKEKYAAIFQLQKNAFDVNVSDELKGMLSECAEDLGAPIVKPPTTLFHCIGFDTMHFGSSTTTVGTLIGLPFMYTIKSVEDIDRKKITVKGKSIDWYSPEGNKLLETFLLSDDAKKFGIAYELSLSNSSKLLTQVWAGPVATYVTAVMNNYFCDAFGLLYRPVIIKGLFYIVLAFFGVGVYFLLKDLTTHFFEYQAIKELAEAGDAYVTGGIEYYNKLLTRNKILRNIIINGSSDFNDKGDVSFLFRRKHVAFTDLKRQLELRQKKDEILKEEVL